MIEKGYNAIGYVLKTHGLQGEITVAFEQHVEPRRLKIIFFKINDLLVPFFIQEVHGRGDKIILRLEGVQSIEQAKQLKGLSVFLPESDEIFKENLLNIQDQPLGFAVTDRQLGDIGIAKEYIEIGRIQFLKVLSSEEKEILIPLDSPFILNTNELEKRIEVDLPDGYLDI